MAGEQRQRPCNESDPGDLAGLLCRQFECLGDVRPMAPRIAEEEDTLRFDFSWPLAPWEALLASSGQTHRLERFRSEFLTAIAPSLAEVVEVATGRRVRAPSAQLETGGREAAVGFALGATTDSWGESSEAIRNWGSQVRRSARRLRADHKQQVERLKRTVRAVGQARPMGGR
jgi:hypothetical protein